VLTFAIPVWEIVLRSTIVYFAFIALVRVGGRREIGQATIFDLAALVLAANALQPAMTGPDSSLAGGLVIVATIFGWNWAVGWARVRFPRIGRLFEFSGGRVLARDGRWIPGAVRAEELDDDELAAALREHGVETVEEVRLVMMEPDGSISVVPYDTGSRTRRRRMKGRRL
jgi:uncharacterized membrane protein YcaP (DUF421 family)